MKHITLIALGLALAMPLHAEDAQEAPVKEGEKVNKAFTKKDKDGDGFLSKDEFTAGAKDVEKAGTAFGKKDKNGDGKLSPEEFAGNGGKQKGGGKGGKKKAQ